MFHMSGVTYQVSGVMSLVSGVRCQVSIDACQVSIYIYLYIFFIFFLKRGGASKRSTNIGRYIVTKRRKLIYTKNAK